MGGVDEELPGLGGQPQVFLYPENWIEPELRDDKSPFFKELESELLQSDLTRESAEAAFLNYLNKLDQVARLEIVGMYHQLEETPDGKLAVNILHVFGRTYSEPRVYYYRRWVNREYLDGVGARRPRHRGRPPDPGRVEPAPLSVLAKIRREGRAADGFAPDRAQARLPPSPPNAVRSSSPGACSTRASGRLAGSRLVITVWFERRFETPPRYIFRLLIDDQNCLNVIPIHPDMVQSIRRFRQQFGTQFSFQFPSFRFANCNSEPVLGSAGGDVIEQPWEVENTQFDRMFLSGIDNSTLYLPTHVPLTPSDTVILHPKSGSLPSPFRLLPHADGASITEHPFFYLDATRTFFVVPKEIAFDLPSWSGPETVDPVRVPVISELYIHRLKKLGLLLADRLGPIDVPARPVAFRAPVPDKAGTADGERWWHPLNGQDRSGGNAISG